MQIKISRKRYCFSCLPKKVCKEKASLRIAKLRKEKPGQKLRKTEQQRKKNSFEILLQLKSKNFEQSPESQFDGACCQKNSDQKNDLVIYREFSRQDDRICFWTASSNFELTSFLRVNLAQTLKKKDTMMLLQ